MSVTPQIGLVRPTFLQSLAITWSNSPNCDFLMILKTLISMLRCVWLKLELNSAGKWISWARFEDPWPIWNNRFWKGLFWFEPFQFNWVAKEWPVNVSILLVALQGCLHQTCMGPKVQKLLWARTGWPTLGHHWINASRAQSWRYLSNYRSMYKTAVTPAFVTIARFWRLAGVNNNLAIWYLPFFG